MDLCQERELPMPCLPRMLMEKYREGQGELHCVFVELEKAYNKFPRKELWYCMKKPGMAEKYVRLVQDMYEEIETVVMCAVETTESFTVKVGLHQESALSLFLFAVIMYRCLESCSSLARDSNRLWSVTGLFSPAFFVNFFCASFCLSFF